MQNFTNPAIEVVIKTAIDNGASDIHLNSEIFPAIRVHGELNYLETSEKFTKAALEKFISEILTPAQLKKFNDTGDLDFAFTYGTQRFRGSLYREMHGLSLTFRL
ncbi:MAG: hypothetical protein IJ597_05555, partial [Synergistaceae bacterium]|nr:hypothetical protein [Synergistaceae bacterium]